MDNKSINSIIGPKSIAVVGATNREGSVGHAVFSNILYNGYKGVLYPVNPGAQYVKSVKAYPSLLDVPDPVDMAVIIVPANVTEQVVEEAAVKGVKGVVIISAGFKEIGGEGVERERRLKALAEEKGIRLVGPNCLGIINTESGVRMNASFARRMPQPGNIAFISQSGALCTAVLDFAAGRHIGFSKVISFGNKADVNEIDLLGYFKGDSQTSVILMYLEDITDGRKFIEIAREITWKSKKPMFAIKSGRSEEGAKAASSHTGSLAGSDFAYDAVFFQSGIQRVEGFNEFFNYAVAYATQPLPKSNRIAIITNAGGPGIMTTDSAIRHGLKLATFKENTLDELRKCLPRTANIKNPVDIIGDASYERYEAAIKAVINDENVHGAIIILTPQEMTNIIETAKVVPRAIKGVIKPVLCAFMGIVDVSDGIKYLEKNGIPNYIFPERAARTMASMVRFNFLLGLKKREIKNYPVDIKVAAEKIKEKLRGKDRYYLSEIEANEILSCYGFPLLKSFLVRKKEELKKALDHVGLPVAMKISSPDIIHKFDAGGVKLKIKTEEEAKSAYDEILENALKYMPGAKISGVMIEAMARGGVEVIIGAHRDPKFGPMCMFGLGGTFVEAIKDVTFRIAPMWEISAELMIKTIKTYKILKGVRGRAPSDIESIKECILRVSQMITNHPEIAEMDINPLIVYPEGNGCVVADSRILLKR
ncbi:MAG: acetate--CoA ligase family protein [Thermodesulfobacteriota bacterium]|nr:acetate--CoA ligase family protein [Thermodesulfobacteriota bacterium]